MNPYNLPRWGLVILATLAMKAAANSQPTWVGTDKPLSSPQQQAIAGADEWLANTQKPTLANNRLQFVFGAGRSVLICAPLQVCTVELEPGELVAKNGLQLGDTARWHVTPIVGAEAQTHLMVKPLVAGLDTTMVIVTDKRAYHLQMISTEKQFMPTIGWYYPKRQHQAWEQYQATQEEQQKKTTLPETRQKLAHLNFDYDISTCKKCFWRPIRIYDDDQRVYIQLPKATAKLADLPVLLVESDGVAGLVNYRFKNSYYIVDHLFTKAWLMSGSKRHQQQVTITRR